MSKVSEGDLRQFSKEGKLNAADNPKGDDNQRN
jgi:hypothetical protein